MSADLPRRLLAEAIGTGILVMFGAGSVVAALTFGGGELDYAGLGMVAMCSGWRSRSRSTRSATRRAHTSTRS
jgi:glycerol uptake facilitator protein